MRVLYFCFALLVISTLSYAQRRHELIDEGWKFHLGNAADPSKDFNYSISTIFAKSGGAWGTAIEPRFNDAEWRTLNLPHDWAVELPFVHVNNADVMSHGYKPVGGLFPETSIGWYRKHFIVAKKDSGHRYQLQFDGVFRNANFWINGFYLGNNMSGYLGIAYDVTDFLNYDRENVLVVRVDATQYEGWFYEGAGIYRHVWLNQYNNVHVATDGLFSSAQVKGQQATVNIESTVANEEFSSAICTITTFITDRSGKKIVQSKEQPVTIAPNSKAIIKHSLAVNSPHLWSIEDPYLYRTTVLIKQNGKVVDSVQQRMGIRTVSIDALHGFSLNGKPVKIKGTNNHQDHAGNKSLSGKIRSINWQMH